MTKNLIIWDDSSRIPFSGMEADWITTPEALMAMGDFSAYSRIFIRERLSWAFDPAPTVSQGINILLHLRYQQVLAPIFLCSVTPREKILEGGDLHFGFLRLTHAHPVLLMPCIVAECPELHTARTLSPLQLQDAVHHFTDPAGVIRERFHYLKNHIANFDEALTQVFTTLEGVIPPAQREALADIRVELEKSTAKDKRGITTKIKETKEAIIALLPKRSRPHDRQMPFTSPWRALYIDDQKVHRDKLRQALSSRGIHCITAASCEEAISILEEDTKNEADRIRQSSWPQNSITVVICDIRFEDEQGNWLPMQGYDLIGHIYEQLPNKLSIVVLSAKNDGIKDMQVNLGHIKYRAFQKDDIFHGRDQGFGLLADHVQQEGDEVFNLLTNIPSARIWGEPWKKKIEIPYGVLYRNHRMNANYLVKEQWINECAATFIEGAALVKEKLLPASAFKKEQLFSTTFKAGIQDIYVTQKALDKFYIKLIGRRIAIGLYIKNWDIGDISDILKYQELDRNGLADQQLFNTYLALSTNLDRAISSQLLVEERSWLQKAIGFSIDPIDRRFFEALRNLLDQHQDKLRKKGCADDFVDEDLSIGDKNKAHRLLKITRKYCQEFNLEADFIQDAKNLFTNPQYAKAVKRNDMMRLLG